MTLYILGGGNDRSYNEFGHRLQEIIHIRYECPKVLDVFFSVEDESHDEKFQVWAEWYQEHFRYEIDRKLAMHTSFLEQVEWADVVYLHGGRTHLLQEALKSYRPSTLKQAFNDKIIIGSSAGANYLSSANYSPKAATLGEGSGIIPFGVVVHYGSSDIDGIIYTAADWLDISTQVKQQAGILPVLLLPEGSFSSIEL